MSFVGTVSIGGLLATMFMPASIDGGIEAVWSIGHVGDEPPRASSDGTSV